MQDFENGSRFIIARDMYEVPAFYGTPRKYKRITLPTGTICTKTGYSNGSLPGGFSIESGPIVSCIVKNITYNQIKLDDDDFFDKINSDGNEVSPAVRLVFGKGGGRNRKTTKKARINRKKTKKIRKSQRK